MRALERNKQTIYYALYEGVSDVVDLHGYKTCEKETTYSNPVKMRLNVSAARGNADVEQFGINDNYTKTLTTDVMDCPIDTDSILWIGISPDSNGESGSIKHNYKVLRVAKSLNSIIYAVAEVNVS